MLASSLHDPDYVRLPAGTDVPDKAERRRLKASCRRFLSGHQPRSMKERLHDLAELAPDDLPDEYGAGEVIEALERRVAGLLGQERAVFVPKGVIAQQAALRVWSERANRRTLVVHPKSHLDLDEEAAYERLHPFRPIRRGSDGAPLAVADLQDVREPIFALTVELPLRRAGFRLPGWEELVGLAGWARERGAAFHLDGARLWEAQPFYGRELAEIAALADSVYVSFYKGLGGLAGCALAGPARFIAETSVWRTRHGASTTSRRRRPRGMPWARSRSATPRVTSAPARSSSSSPASRVEGRGMTQPRLDELSLRHMDAVLRLLLTAVHQQFLHVLLLRSWGDAETERRIRAVDAVDFPTALRMIDHLVAAGAPPELCPNGLPFAAHLPAPGASRGGVLAAELALERRLLGVVEAAREGLAGGGSRDAAALLVDALAPRLPHLTWLERQLSGGPAAPIEPPVPAFGDATASLDLLLAWLVVAIEQELVTAFALWHAGASEAAEAAWGASGTAMRQATALVELFAARGAAPAPARAACLASLEPPRVSGDAAEAARLGRALAGRCHAVAAAAAAHAAGTEAASLCWGIAASQRDARDQPFRQGRGSARPSATFPSFTAMHQRYVSGLVCTRVP